MTFYYSMWLEFLRHGIRLFMKDRCSILLYTASSLFCVFLFGPFTVSLMVGLYIQGGAYSREGFSPLDL